jgi:SNF2 family DNA or RNA helicase
MLVPPPPLQRVSHSLSLAAFCSRSQAHNIKNFKSQRWQTLLHFRTHRRLLLTGTPLQNSVQELWALMHFLMPNVFQSQAEFKEWFSNPVLAMVEGREGVNNNLLNRLHGILRPFLLRRLKSAVAQQLPAKYEHTLYCKMSKRQRYLYEDFMAASDTQRTLASGNFMGMMNVVMSLRKVCNHPDLFAGRPIVSPFDVIALNVRVPSRILHLVPQPEDEPLLVRRLEQVELLYMLLQAHQRRTTQWEAAQIAALAPTKHDFDNLPRDPSEDNFDSARYPVDPAAVPFVNQQRTMKLQWRVSRRAHMAAINSIRTQKLDFSPFGADVLRVCQLGPLKRDVHAVPVTQLAETSSVLRTWVRTYEDRADQMQSTIDRVCCIIPRARARPANLVCSKPDRTRAATAAERYARLHALLGPTTDIFRTSFARQQIFFPDKYLLQWDCGKLQRLAVLLRERKAGDHRVLIFSQFSRMLDILESFLSMHGYTYLRLDGSTKVEERARLMERFNRDNKYFVFILSTRSGGIGINLTGADTCVMYDSDWNPAQVRRGNGELRVFLLGEQCSLICCMLLFCI